MKEANVIVHLDKNTSVHRAAVTPLEALLLTAEHHKNVGADVIIVDKDTIKEIVVEETKDGKVVKRSRTDDEEIARLKSRYNNNKIRAVLAEVRTIPDDFEKAKATGLSIVLPVQKLSETKLL